MEIKRGDIWYVSKDNYTGCEQAADRPAIIVSNEKNNACAETVEVVQIYTLRKIVVQLVDSLTANPCDTSKVALCHPPFAKAG